MVELTLYVEGGGSSNFLRTRCREGFRQFLENAGLKGQMPGIVACGGRGRAFDRFRLAVEHGDRAMLLVDSEDPVKVSSPWAHLRQRPDDRWETPPGATDDDCHLMVQCMESWFLGDLVALTAFFGKGFRAPKATKPVEQVLKAAALKALGTATKDCRPKGPYDKGRHSFDLLARIDPTQVTRASKWAARFLNTLRSKMAA